MVDKSWGVAGSSALRVRSNLSLEERAAERARAREERSSGRSDVMGARLEARSAAREVQAQERERARQERRDAEMKLTASDPHKAAEQRRRGSGRKDIVREQRDTSGYAMVVDADRIRKLAARGASAESLAAVFAMPVDEIQRTLSGGE